MKIICTICSRAKREDAELLPAEERYTATHIKTVKEIAQKDGVPFYILSGKYGLISSQTKIPYYDYYLENSAVDELSERVSKQIQEVGITEINFYGEEKDSWLPYKNALEKGVKSSGIILNNYIL